MKRTILTLALTFMVILTGQAVPTIKATPAGKQVESVVDNNVVTKGGDTVVIADAEALAKVKDKINDVLDDTIANSNGTVVTMDRDVTSEDMKAMSDKWAEAVTLISYASIGGLLLLVLLILWFRYLNRRNKYRVMEKAIENNYPLPDGMLSDTRRTVYVQQPVVTTPVPPQMPNNVTNGENASKVPVGQPIYTQADVFNWRALMPAIKPLGWGIGICLFGLFVGAEPFTAIGLAFALVGLCKGFILYQEQKSLQQAFKNTSQQQQAWPQQPAQQGQPMPPTFNGEQNNNNESSAQ